MYVSHSALRRISLLTGRVKSHGKDVTANIKHKAKDFLGVIVKDAIIAERFRGERDDIIMKIS